MLLIGGARSTLPQTFCKEKHGRHETSGNLEESLILHRGTLPKKDECSSAEDYISFPCEIRIHAQFSAMMLETCWSERNPTLRSPPQQFRSKSSLLRKASHDARPTTESIWRRSCRGHQHYGLGRSAAPVALARRSRTYPDAKGVRAGHTRLFRPPKIANFCTLI